MILLMAALLGGALFGSLGLWAEDLLLTVLTTLFGGSLFAASAGLLHTYRHFYDQD